MTVIQISALRRINNPKVSQFWLFSVCFEGVFNPESLIQWEQDCALVDYIQASVIAQYNKR